MSCAQKPDRVVRETVNEEETKFRIYHSDPDFAGRITVEREEEWEFGIHGEGAAELLTTTTAADLVDDPEIPMWLADSLYGLGIEEIEGIAGVV